MIERAVKKTHKNDYATVREGFFFFLFFIIGKRENREAFGKSGNGEEQRGKAEKGTDC